MHEKILGSSLSGRFCELLESVGIGDFELGDCGTA
jgi:hypothetical protein